MQVKKEYIPECGTIQDRSAQESYEERFLSPCAACSKEWGHTRLYQENRHKYRTAFQRDRDRIIHSRAFRRLKHKRQVFLISYGDHYRTRLTHTLEVSQLSRTIARCLGLNEDLTEAIALGHDLGHTPFGHIGEVVLHRIMSGQDDLDETLILGNAGGFKHNYQSLRVVDVNEKKYEFDGLNLTAAVREGILKHTRLRRDAINYPDFKSDGLNYEIDTPTTLEGQNVGICDEIAQRTHDLEDGLRAGYVSVEDVHQIKLIKHMEKAGQLVSPQHQDPFYYRNHLIRALVNFLTTDVIENSIQNMRRFVEKNGRTQFFDDTVIWFSEKVDPLQQELDQFIMKNIISLASEKRRDESAKKTIRFLFKTFYHHPNILPAYRLQQCADRQTMNIIYNGNDQDKMTKINQLKTKPQFARAVCDYISGMTDHFAEKMATKLNQISKEQIFAMRADKDISGI